MSVIDRELRIPQCARMLSHDDILSEFRSWIDAKRVSQKEIADELGVPPPRVNEIYKGTRRIQQVEMPKLAKLFGMSDPSESGVRRIKRLGRVPAGSFREALAETTDSIEVSAGVPKGSVALEVDGESMNKVAPFGCDVIVDLDDKSLFHRDMYVLMNDDGELTFKRYLENPARLEPLSRDKSHKVIPLGSEPVNIVGRVVSVLLGAEQLRRIE